MKMKYLKLVIWVVALIVMSSVIGSMTRMPMDPWYDNLVRSPLTPPSYIFGIVWTILYIMIAISGWIIWESRDNSNLLFLRKLYIAQLILNWCWMPLFFKYKLVGSALICLFLIILLVALLVLRACKSHKVISILLMPYLSWLLLAFHLNSYIWLYN